MPTGPDPHRTANNLPTTFTDTVTLENTLSVEGATKLTSARVRNSPFSIKDPNRVYYEEYFDLLPGLSADMVLDLTGNDAADKTEVELALSKNKHFEVLGSGGTSDDVTHGQGAGVACGILMQTDDGDNKSVIILPRLLIGTVEGSGWSATEWGTENQVQWECAIRTDSALTTSGFWAGLKLTNTDVYATNADQAYFLFCTDNDSGVLTTNANLHCVVSVGDTDYITDLGIAVAADTNYRLGLEIDSDRKVSAWVNGTQYSLTSAATVGGVTTGIGTALSPALTNDVDLIPYVGVIARAGSVQRKLHLFYEKISRILFE